MSEVIWIEVDEDLSVGVPVGTPFFDDELVAPWEYLGFATFAWLPKKCRNGKLRWLCWVDQHRDGTYTKSK